MRNDFGNFIDGAWVDAVSGETFENLNPADRREVIGSFARSGGEDVDRAVGAAVRLSAASRPAARGAQGRVVENDDSRDGEDTQRVAWRHSRGH